MKIWYIRHAKTKANSGNKWQGVSDTDLSNEGLKELEELSKNINMKFDIVISSPLKRAFQTALIFKNKDEIIIDPLITERNFGSLELLDVNDNDKELLSNFEINTDLNKGVEKIQSMYYDRIKKFLEKIKEKYGNTNNKILIVSHSWVGRLLSFYSSKEKDPNLIKVAPKNLEIYEFEI